MEIADFLTKLQLDLVQLQHRVGQIKDGRHKSIALTHLETAEMYLKRAVETNGLKDE